jgi:hypothetical protein
LSRYHGRFSRVYLSPNDTAAAHPLLSISGWSFDNTKDRADTTSFEDSVKTSVLGFGSGQITFQGFWDDTELTLYEAAESPAGAKFYGYPATTAPSLYIAARVWVDYSMPDISVNAAVPVRGNLAVKSDFINTMS